MHGEDMGNSTARTEGMVLKRFRDKVYIAPTDAVYLFLLFSKSFY